VAFLEAYYEFLEQPGNVNNILSKGIDIGDIDKTLDVFVQYFMDVYAQDIPDSIMADKRLFLKHIGDLYKAKGSEKAYKLFFRIYSNDNATIQYPKDYILRASDGHWDSVDNKFNGAYGLLSDYAKLQDNYYYQDFSYVVRVGESITSWRDKVKNILHPAGFMMFGEVFIQEEIDVRSEPGFDGSVNVALNYVMLMLKAFIDKSVELMNNNGPTILLYPKIECESGFNWSEWDRIKFKVPPSIIETDFLMLEGGLGHLLFEDMVLIDINDAVAGTYDKYGMDYGGTNNAGYWNTFANLQIKDFGYVVIREAINGAFTNIMPEPYMKITGSGELLLEGGMGHLTLEDSSFIDRFTL
jgi:hypothetical protein